MPALVSYIHYLAFGLVAAGCAADPSLEEANAKEGPIDNVRAARRIQ